MRLQLMNKRAFSLCIQEILRRTGQRDFGYGRTLFAVLSSKMGKQKEVPLEYLSSLGEIVLLSS